MAENDTASHSNNRRIAKNTLFLYIRMLLVMAVTLYTSRVILTALGVEDFGIYNVVGGLSSSFVFFSSSLSNATQRFLNFALGQKDIGQSTRIFNLSLLVYAIIVVIVLVLVESLGTWFLYHKLVIPAGQMDAAFWILQTTTLSLCVQLLGAPFDAVIISRENMKFYAYIGIIEAVCKLLLAYMISIADWNRLILYGCLLLCMTVIIKSAVVLYCRKKYEECTFRFYWDKSLFKEMFSFVGWNGVGTAVWAVNEQGMSILLNIFFGPIVNAAKAIAQQVNAAINNFSTNFFTAVRPQIVKTYAANDYDSFIRLIFDSSKFTFYLMWILSLPILLRTDYILYIWLKTPPEQSAIFIKWILAYSLVNSLTSPFWCAIQAVGKMKKYILIGSMVYLLAFPISYVFLRLGFTAVIVFQTLTVIRFIYLYVILTIVREYVYFSICKYTKDIILPIIAVVTVSGIFMSFINPLFNESFISLILISFISIIMAAITISIFGLNRQERYLLINKLRTILHV